MSGGDRKDAPVGQAVVPYEVGYGKPPVKHRFQKGLSGNPNGRPRGAKNKPKVLIAHNKPTDGLILEEAYRMVTIREGDKVIELPAIQASMRSLAISAMKGSRLSQKLFSEIVRQVEERRHADQVSLFETMFEYKTMWTEELARRQHLGITEPDPVPHPDHIILDAKTGDVRIEGPMDALDKESWDKRFARRAEAQEEVNYFAERYRKARKSEAKASCLEEWHFEQRIFDIINDSFPDRHKVKLENRSYREGASREGKTLIEVLKNKKLRDEYVG